MVNKKIFYRCVSLLVAVTMILQVNTATTSAMEVINDDTENIYGGSSFGDRSMLYGESSTYWEESRLPKGNVVTKYINKEEGNQKRTIHWVNGVNPPKMGGENPDFVTNFETYGGKEYITYTAPYHENRGWYDVNKFFNGDQFLCFVAATANSLQWWMNINRDNIERYLSANQQYTQNKKDYIEMVLNKKDINQANSPIYDKYFNIFNNRKEGYWPDLLIGHYVNGYPFKEKGGTIDPDPIYGDGAKLLENGPHFAGGYFFDVFKEKTLSYRYLISTYQEMKNILKEIDNGSIIMLSYQLSNTVSHVVTLWGVEYDEKGNPVAVYYTDSDDENDVNVGMRRYKVVEKRGLPYITTEETGKLGGSLIQALITLSPGSEKAWENSYNVKELELEWQDELIYNGTPQKPTVTAKNIDKGDDIELIVTGEGTDAGEYEATVTMNGKSAYKYILPQETTRKFTIKKAKPQVNLDIEVNSDKSIIFDINVKGINDIGLNGTVKIKDGDVEIADIDVRNGVARFVWKNPNVTANNFVAEFTPLNTEGKNYDVSSSESKNPDETKIEQKPLYISEISEKKYGYPDFKLETSGGSVFGKVVYTSDRPDILSVNNDMATIHKVGTVMITATLKGNDKYKDAVAKYELTIKKADAPILTFPKATEISYGQKLSDSKLVGGTAGFGAFEWVDENIVPTVKNSGYAVKFVPSYETTQNYEPISNLTKAVQIDVQKVDTNLNLIAEPIHKDNKINIGLSLYVEKSGFGEASTGKVKFIDCTDNKSTELAEVSLTNGVATFMWEDLSQQIYSVKAVYSGDDNYSAKTTLPIDIDIRKKPQEHFEFENIGNKTYGDKEFKLVANGGTGNGKISFNSNNPNVISIDGDIATIHNVGDAIITATKKGNEEYNDAVSTINITVNKKLLVVKADDKKIVKGSAMPKFTYRVDGLVNGDKLTQEPNISTNLQDTNIVGKHIISVTGANFTNIENYNVIYKDGVLLIVNSSNPDGGSGDDSDSSDSSSSENSSKPESSGSGNSNRPNYDTDDDYNNNSSSNNSSVSENSVITNKFVQDEKSEQSSTSTSTVTKEPLKEENISSDSSESGSGEISESSINSSPTEIKQEYTENTNKTETRKNIAKAIAIIIAVGFVSLGIFYVVKFKKFKN